MSTKGESLAEKVQASYLTLSLVASDLNSVSDELGKCVADIDAALKKLNLGISVWVTVVNHDFEDMTYSMERIGYDKIDGKWGLALRTVEGDSNDPERSVSEQWLFNDAPRKIRLNSIEKLPQLLKTLSEEAVKTTNEIKGRLAEAKEVAAAVKEVADGPERRVRRVVASGGTANQAQPPVWTPVTAVPK
jgi:hypothetical protein